MQTTSNNRYKWDFGGGDSRKAGTGGDVRVPGRCRRPGKVYSASSYNIVGTIIIRVNSLYNTLHGSDHSL